MVIGMKKRLIAALLAGMMLVQTTACGNSTSGTVGTVDNTETMSESGTEADTEKEGDEVTALSLMQQVNTAEENVIDRKSTRLNSSHTRPSRMPSSA